MNITQLLEQMKQADKKTEELKVRKEAKTPRSSLTPKQQYLRSKIRGWR